MLSTGLLLGIKVNALKFVGDDYAVYIWDICMYVCMSQALKSFGVIEML